MKHQQLAAALAAFLLSGLLIGCSGADEAADATAVPVVADLVVATPAVADPTRPPPVIAANTADPAESAGGDTESAPAMPTAVPTDVTTKAPPTEVPTETVEPTAVPPTAAPVVQPPPAQPTAVPPTAVPPTAVPQTGANGLTASHFAVQPRAELFVNGDVWFEFTIANATGNDVPFDALGVMPKKDGVDRPQWYQHSYGGNNDVISPGGLSWDDHINLPEAGNYTLRMVVCFDGPACLAQTGTWHTLSNEIPVTIVQR